MAYYCPGCGEPVKNSARFCPNCGKQLVDDLEDIDFTSNTSTVTQGNMQYQAQQNMHDMVDDDDYLEEEEVYEQPQVDPYQEYLRHTYDYKGHDKVEYHSTYQAPRNRRIDYESYVNYNWPKRSRIAAGVLAIVLGGFGIHKFYLGKVGQGIMMLLFNWTGIPWLIGLIQGIIYLTQSDEEFSMKNQVRVTD